MRPRRWWRSIRRSRRPAGIAFSAVSTREHLGFRTSRGGSRGPRGSAISGSRCSTAPKNFVNRHFLAEALANGDPSGKAEAIRIEAELVADTPSPAHLVEDLAIQDEAKKNLAAWKAGS